MLRIFLFKQRISCQHLNWTRLESCRLIRSGIRAFFKRSMLCFQSTFGFSSVAVLEILKEKMFHCQWFYNDAGWSNCCHIFSWHLVCGDFNVRSILLATWGLSILIRRNQPVYLNWVKTIRTIGLKTAVISQLSQSRFAQSRAVNTKWFPQHGTSPEYSSTWTSVFVCDGRKE